MTEENKDEPVVSERCYDGERIFMEEVMVQIKDGELTLPLKKVDQKGLVSFSVSEDVPSGRSDILGMSYISPSGRIFVGEKRCKSCGGKEYFIDSDTLVCNGCFVAYDLETRDELEGPAASDGYLPKKIEYELIKGQIVIDLDQF